MKPEPYSFGLIGYPLDHSLSPQIHRAALQALGLRGEYQLYPVLPLNPGLPASGSEESLMTNYPLGAGEGLELGEEQNFALTDLLSQMRAGQIHGLNVTIPHKQSIIPLLDELTPPARAIGAVNTIFWQGSLLTGDNTDAPGFWGDLQRFEASGERQAEGDFGFSPSALLLGAGGSARAVAYALLTHGWQVVIAARRVEQAEKICRRWNFSSPKLTVCSLSNVSRFTAHGSLIVNCTPVGMYPHENASPWPADLPFPKNATIYDLIYNPRETLLLKKARAAGLLAISGLGMLIEQAALAFERWTGRPAHRQAMMAAVNFCYLE